MVNNRDLRIGYAILSDHLRRSIKGGTNEVRPFLNQAETLAILLCLEEAGVCTKGYTQKSIEEAKNGPAWMPEWAKKVIKR